MVQTLFFLRFKSQLCRTRPDLVRRVERSVAEAFKGAQGKINSGRSCGSAVYDGLSPGFWLDILLLIETIKNTLDGEKSGLYGYSLLVGRDFDSSSGALCRFLASGPREGGIFLDETARNALSPYLEFECVEIWPDVKHAVLPGRARDMEKLTRVKTFKNFSLQAERIFPLRETIVKALRQNTERGMLIIGPEFSGKRDGICQYCRELQENFPPLRVHFGGGGGINPLVEAWSAEIRTIAAAGNARGGAADELDALGEFLFKDRLRGELPPRIIEKGFRFFSLLLETYTEAAKREGAAAVLTLENIHLAEKDTARIVIDVYTAAAADRPELRALGTCSNGANDKELINWDTVFPRMIKLKAENAPFQPAGIPGDLWEIAYAVNLFSRCFPARLFPALFEEEGKNPQVIERAYSLLLAYGLIDTPLDPRPRIKDFTARAQAALGETSHLIRTMTHRLIVTWVEKKKLNPCFRLLAVLKELQTENSFSDDLILKAVYADLIAGTVSQIEDAQISGTFIKMFGAEKAGIIKYIYQTMRALLTGGENEIKAAFANPAPDSSAFPVLKARILVNQVCAYLGQRDIKPALESVKEAIQISQQKNDFCLAQSYRLFSLVNFLRRQPGETNNYLDFAIENAEKSGNSRELGISAYYAAVSQFLFGNISKAIRLARRAREESLAADCLEWADRACFLEGRFVFETGGYREACEIFESLRQNPPGETYPEKDSLLSAWIYRARVFFQNPLIEKPADGGHDAGLFEIEAAYLAGDFRKAAELSKLRDNPYAGQNFLFTEQPDWRSGFAQCELLYFSRGEVWDRLVCAYHSLSLSRSSAGEEAAHAIQRILRDEHLSEIDPWDAFYFYAWYRILEETGAGQVDMNTAISMAFKRLQRRASRIDDIEIRQRYLTRPRWNSALSRAAKEYRLI